MAASGKLLRSCLFLSMFGPAVLSSASVLAAGGSFVVDDYSIDDVGACNVESWASFARNNDLVMATSPACVVRLGVPVEIGSQFQRTRSNGEWQSVGGISGKTTLLPLTRGVGIGISGQINWDMQTGASTGGNFNVPVTFDGGWPLRVHVNAGYIRDQKDRVDYASWGVGLEYDLNKQWQVIAEVFGQIASHAPEPSLAQPRAQIGLRVTPVDAFDIDLIYGHNINGENSQWITVGLNIRFDVIPPAKPAKPAR